MSFGWETLRLLVVWLIERSHSTDDGSRQQWLLAMHVAERGCNLRFVFLPCVASSRARGHHEPGRAWFGSRAALDHLDTYRAETTLRVVGASGNKRLSSG